MTDEAHSAGRASHRKQRHAKILWGLLFGLVAGLAVHTLAGGQPWVEWSVRNVAYPVGQLFLRLIFMVVVPLVFSSLVLGVLELGDVRRLGRVGLTTLAYTLLASGISVAIGDLPPSASSSRASEWTGRRWARFPGRSPRSRAPRSRTRRRPCPGRTRFFR